MSGLALSVPRPRPIGTRREFRALSRSRRRGRSGALWVVRAEHPDGVDEPAVAYAIGRSVGSAVVRNRVRRRLRELMSTRVGAQSGLFLVGAAPEAADLGFRALERQLDAALESVA